jgi:hypothetical protein
MATLFVRALGVNVEGKAAGLTLSDKDSISSYAKDAVAYAVEVKLINGYGDGRFSPQGQATRDAVAKVASQFLKVVESNKPKPEPEQPTPTPSPGTSSPSPSQSAQQLAIEKIESVVQGSEIESISDINQTVINTAMGSQLADSENLSIYQLAIVDANDGDLNSAQKITDMVTSINKMFTKVDTGVSATFGDGFWVDINHNELPTSVKDDWKYAVSGTFFEYTKDAMYSFSKALKNPELYNIILHEKTVEESTRFSPSGVPFMQNVVFFLDESKSIIGFYEVETEGEEEPEVTNEQPTVSTPVQDYYFKFAGTLSSIDLEAEGAKVFEDSDGDELHYSVESSDESIVTAYIGNDSFDTDPDGKILYIEPTSFETAKGSSTITLTATDGNGGESTTTFTVQVKPVEQITFNFSGGNTVDPLSPNPGQLQSEPDADGLFKFMINKDIETAQDQYSFALNNAVIDFNATNISNESFPTYLTDVTGDASEYYADAMALNNGKVPYGSLQKNDIGKWQLVPYSNLENKPQTFQTTGTFTLVTEVTDTNGNKINIPVVLEVTEAALN